MDTVYSGKNAKDKHCLLVLAKRCTRCYTTIQIADRSSSSVNKALEEFIQQTSTNKTKTITITYDRCKEFSGYKEIETLFNIEIYFTDPYCVWQKKQLKI